jgi:phospho-N-acetylmuramoyl-pentapeptide-transferase
MIAIIIAVGASLVCSLIFTRILIRFLTKHQMGQFIRQDGPESHLVKRGTPTMGGIAIVVSILFSQIVAWAFIYQTQHALPTITTFLLFGITFAMAAIGFVDDFSKISQQRSLGLTASLKMVLQILVGSIFAFLVLQFPDELGITPATDKFSFLGDFGLNFMALGSIFGWVIFIIWINLIITAWTNAVNLTDGLDGLAIGVSLFAFAAYFAISFWQLQHLCSGEGADLICYNVRDPLEITLFAASILGAAFGFLWWNASPAKIFMGDTGSLALGGAFAGMSVLTHTEFLAVLIGGVFVIECMSDVIQVVSFKARHKRVFKMAPIHHHFELKGWSEVNVVIRFWIVSALFAGLALAIFYAEWARGLFFG